MARIETWFNQDLQNAVKVNYLDGNVFSADNQGNVVGVNVYDNGEPATLGGSVSANIIRADGVTVAATGTLSGNKCSVVLPQSAYSVPGIISIIIKLTSGSDITTVCAVVSNVYTSSTDSVVDPGTIIPSIETLIAEIEAAVASIPADYSDLWALFAPNFSTDVAYSVGQYCTTIKTYTDSLYRIPVLGQALTLLLFLWAKGFMTYRKRFFRTILSMFLTYFMLQQAVRITAQRMLGIIIRVP